MSGQVKRKGVVKQHTAFMTSLSVNCIDSLFGVRLRRYPEEHKRALQWGKWCQHSPGWLCNHL